MAYRIAGIDVHKKMVAVAIADVEVVGRRGDSTGGRSGRARASCARWRSGSWRARSTKW
jgi:hypothetical protein